MTYEELLAKATDATRPVFEQYGPTIIKMAVEDQQKWVQYVFVGQYEKAYVLYLKAAGADDILGEWDKEHSAWVADNAANADKIALSKEIGFAMSKAMLVVMLAAVGL